MLALRRLSSVETPASECSTSWTRCCVCVSCDAVRCSGDAGTGAGAGASTGDDRAPSPLGAETAVKSGLKLSALSMGGMAGGAAIAGAAAGCVVWVSFQGCRHKRSCQLRSTVWRGSRMHRPALKCTRRVCTDGCCIIFATSSIVRYCPYCPSPITCCRSSVKTSPRAFPLPSYIAANTHSWNKADHPARHGHRAPHNNHPQRPARGSSDMPTERAIRKSLLALLSQLPPVLATRPIWSSLA